MMQSDAGAEKLIRHYYECFNARRLSDAAALFADDAVIEHMPRRQALRGGSGYRQFADAWLTAFPDASIAVDRVVSRDARTLEVSLVITGTHSGALDLGGWIFRPTDTHAKLDVRDLIQFRDGKIVFSGLSFDFHQMVEQLVRVDASKLLESLDRIRQVTDQLRDARDDAALTREIIDRVGRELDAARHIVRPYYR